MDIEGKSGVFGLRRSGGKITVRLLLDAKTPFSRSLEATSPACSLLRSYGSQQLPRSEAVSSSEIVVGLSACLLTMAAPSSQAGSTVEK